SVASISFLKRGIERTMREVPREKIVAALPFYTRIWKIYTEGRPDSETLGMSATSEFVSSHNMEVYWDDETCQNIAESDAGDYYLKIWIEDAASLKEKMAVVKENDIAGTAAWRLGLETPDVWEILAW
ncbi:MAG: hypothetical protein KBS83_08590, partial [Lachnospiraceae bacterium]|nr:hypothetical protein [Candidatus Equihabitans merdae]